MERNTFIDSVKFSLIILVVVGHVIAPYSNNNTIVKASHNLIYSFHMPLFVFVSGYFSKTTDPKKIKNQVLRIFETYIIIQLFGYLPEIIQGEMSLIKALTPWWISWYLLSLCFWKIFYFYINQITLNKKFVLFTSLTIALVAGFVKYIDYPLSLSRTLVFFPFFILGALASNDFWIKVRSFNKIYSLLFLTALFMVFLVIDKSFVSVFHGSNTYMKYDQPELHLVMRSLLYPLAVITSLAFINLCPNLKLFSSLGKDTLIYYIYHGFIVCLFRISVVGLNYTFSLIELLIISILIISFIFLLSRFKITSVFLNPITTIRDEKSHKKN